MKVEGEGRLLRIFVGEDDRREGRPPYEAIVPVLDSMVSMVSMVSEGLMTLEKMHTMADRHGGERPSRTEG